MISSAAKRKIKAKDDKMLTLERYFESCGRDLSRTLSWTKWYGLYQNLALAVASHARKRDFSKTMAAIVQEKDLTNKVWATQISKQQLRPNTSWNNLEQKKHENANQIEKKIA